MAFLAGPETLDTPSTDGNCLYPAAPVGGAAVPTTIKVGGVPLEIIAGIPVPYQCTPVEGIKVNPALPLPCQPGQRTIVPKINKTVFINGQLPAVSGDEARLLIGSTDRPLTGPFQYPTIVIGTQTAV